MDKKTRYLLLTPLQDKVVAALLAGADIAAQVFALQSGACVLREVEIDPWDAASGYVDEAILAAANKLSKLSAYGVVLMTSNPQAGQVTAVRYLNGSRGEELAAGMVINSLEGRVEDLLLHGGNDGIDTTTLGSEQIMEIIAPLLKGEK